MGRGRCGSPTLQARPTSELEDNIYKSLGYVRLKCSGLGQILSALCKLHVSLTCIWYVAIRDSKAVLSWYKVFELTPKWLSTGPIALPRRAYLAAVVCLQAYNVYFSLAAQGGIV